MIIESTVNGALSIKDRDINNDLFKMLYIDFTRDEAIKRFQEQLSDHNKAIKKNTFYSQEDNNYIVFY